VRLVGEWHNIQNLPWEEMLVDDLIRKPRDYPTVLHMIWVLPKQFQPQLV